jgi:hypothetical protein
MLSLAPRRRAFSAITALAVTAALAGCGSDKTDTGSTGGGGDTSDGRALLKDGFLKVSKDGAAITSGSGKVTITGKVDAPKDKDLKHLEGTVTINAAVEKKASASKAFPPFKFDFSADGNFTSGDGKKLDGKYAGGVSYIGDAFYANWEGKDYAVGEELSAQAVQAIQQQEKKAGASTSDPLGGTDPQKLIDAMDLDPGTWLKDVDTADGGTLDGVETTKVSGPVDTPAAVNDIVDGLQKLPAAVPNVPGIEQLKSVKKPTDAELKDVTDDIKTLEMSAWIGKDDHLERKLEIHIVVESSDDSGPVNADITLDIESSKFNQDQGLKAPTNTNPITDLALKLQKQFGGADSALKNIFS